MATLVFATPVHLRCEYRQNPLGIDASPPHLSWQSDNGERNWKQSAYQILVASNSDILRSGHGDVWDSGKINSDESVGIEYKGPELLSRKRYFWKVRVWDAAGKHPNLWRTLGGRWAFFVPRTGLRNGSHGRTRKMRRTAKASGGSG